MEGGGRKEPDAGARRTRLRATRGMPRRGHVRRSAEFLTYPAPPILEVWWSKSTTDGGSNDRPLLVKTLSPLTGTLKNLAGRRRVREARGEMTAHLVGKSQQKSQYITFRSTIAGEMMMSLFSK